MGELNSAPVSGVIVYVLRQMGAAKQVLFLHRSGGQFGRSWWPVAGTPKENETPLKTAQRELKEETGLVVDGWEPFGINIPNADGVQILKAFVVTVTTQPIQLNYEHDDYKWLTPRQALGQVPPHSRRFIQHLIDNFMGGKSEV